MNAAAPAPLVQRLEADAPFAESHPGEDAAVLRERLERDGYLFVRGLVDRDRLLRVRREILELCREHGWLKPGSELMDGIYSGRPFPDDHTEYMPLYRKLINGDAFNACSIAPEIVQFYARLLGGAILAHPRNIARISFPRNHGYTTQPHQDYFYIHGTPETYTTWIPLSDCPRELGGLAVLEGSHHRGFVPHESTIGAGGNGVRTGDTGLRWVSSDYRLGDLVLFHSYTVHAAFDNDTADRLRISLDYRYQRADQPVDPSSLRQHLT
jgi:ectoine hydroxylase-related dioxygenase (phytanoyl-CoA dioxygenase family)